MLLLLVFELIPSVAERSAFFVKELSFHRRRQTDDAFSTGIRLERAGFARPFSSSGHWTPLQKQETEKDRRGLACCLSDA